MPNVGGGRGFFGFAATGDTVSDGWGVRRGSEVPGDTASAGAPGAGTAGSRYWVSPPPKPEYSAGSVTTGAVPPGLLCRRTPGSEGCGEGTVRLPGAVYTVVAAVGETALPARTHCWLAASQTREPAGVFDPSWGRAICCCTGAWRDSHRWEEAVRLVRRCSGDSMERSSLRVTLRKKFPARSAADSLRRVPEDWLQAGGSMLHVSTRTSPAERRGKALVFMAEVRWFPLNRINTAHWMPGGSCPACFIHAAPA